MNTDFKLLDRITLVFLLGVVLAGCASGPKDPSPELLQQIEAASTRSDHEALVSYYERKPLEPAPVHLDIARWPGVTR